MTSPVPEANEAALAELLGAHRLLIAPSPESNDIGMFVKVTCTCGDEWDASMPPEDWFNEHLAAAVLAAGWLPPETVTEARAAAVREAADAFQMNTWADVITPALKTEGIPALAVGQAVIDWLRARADSLAPEAPSEACPACGNEARTCCLYAYDHRYDPALRQRVESAIDLYVQMGTDPENIEPEDGFRLIRDLRAALSAPSEAGR